MERDYSQEYTDECYYNYYNEYEDREDYYAYKADERYLDSLEED